MAEGRETVHIPNSGRLQELLFPGNQVGLNYEGHEGRKTRYTLVSAETEAGSAFIDARLPNRILAQAWQKLTPLSIYDQVYPERTWGSSQFDLALKRTTLPRRPGWKRSALRWCGTGQAFPDAPTEQGRKHLLELAKLSADGKRPLFFFFSSIQGSASKRIEMDPKFTAAVTIAAQAEWLYAYRVLFTEETVVLAEVPVLFPPD